MTEVGTTTSRGFTRFLKVTMKEDPEGAWAEYGNPFFVAAEVSGLWPSGWRFVSSDEPGYHPTHPDHP
jgi:hypothetical protein